MNESVLRDYFVGQIDTSLLAKDLKGSVVQTSYDVFTHYVNEMDGEFRVNPSHLVKLCDAVLAGDLPPGDLSIIGYCLVTSDHFSWEQDSKDGDLVAETAYDWSSPEINFPLTVDNVAKFRDRLLTGHDPFTCADAVG